MNITPGKRVPVKDFNDEQPTTSELLANYNEQNLSSNDSENEESNKKDSVQSDESIIQVSIDDITTGDYLLVNVANRRKKAKKYICLVQGVQEDGVDVVFLEKLHEPNVFILKQNDCAFVFEDEVEGKLKEPRLAKRGGIIFDINCSQWNIA